MQLTRSYSDNRLSMIMTNSNSIQDVLFFPQMRPDKGAFASTDKIGEQDSEQMKPEKKAAPTIELNDNEKAVMAIIQKESPMDLNALKEQSGLSNKQWDKTVKSLRNHGLINIEKNNDGLTVTMV